MKLHIFKNPGQVSVALADWIINYIEEVLKTQDRFTWALSGGNSPKGLYELLGGSPYREKIPWSKMHFFWGDERFVPFDDPHNNGKMVYEVFLKNVPVPVDQIHYIRTDIAPEESAQEYEKILHQYFDNQNSSFDLVLLGLGEDGHTLSLFPHSPLIHEKKVWVKSFYLPEQEMYRITLTPSIVNRASRVAFLVNGKEKAFTLKQVIRGEFNPDKFPAQIIQASSGGLHWFIDEEAASFYS